MKPILRKGALTLGMVACLTGGANAQTGEQTRELYRSGLWSAYTGTDAGRPFCGVATGGGEGRRVAIQQYAGDPGIEVLLSKGSWSIPDNTPVTVQFQFDNRGETPGRATGHGRTIAQHMGFEQSVPFMRAMRNGRVLQVIFPDGNEPAWTGGLSGSGNAITAFNNCRTSLAPAEPTQPFNAPTQSAPQPTQPQAQQLPPLQPGPVQQ